MSPRLSRLAAIPAALLLLVAVAGPALAHADLVASDPEDGAVLATPPVEVRLTFSEGVDAGKSSFRLLGPAGEVGTAKPARDGAKLMVLDGLTLAAGDYTIRWTVGSGDGHLERGTLGFTVLPTAATPGRATPAPPATARAEPQATDAATPSPATSSPSATSPAGTAAPAPTPASSGTGGTPASASGADVLIPIVVALALVAGVGALVLRRSRRA